MGGLAVVRERFPRPSRLRILLPRWALPAKGAEARAHYQLLATTPAELVLDSQLTQGADARRLHRWLAQEGVEVRTVAAEALLPGMAGVGEALLVGNPELTRECLGPTRMMVEAGLFAPDAASRAALLAVYERLWAQGTEAKEALRQRLLDYARPASPRFLYHLSLWHLFRDRLEAWRSAFVGDVRLAETPIWKALYPFQRHGAMAALRRLRKDGGCVLADSVGLGKTYTALAVIKAYERMGQGRVLVLCPKKLRANWERFLRPDAYNPFADVNGRPDFYYHVLNHTDLGRAAFETGHGKVEAERFWPRGFSLIVIDESHNFRNRGGQRYQFLLQHLREHRETHLLFLTATPVSNRLTDLTNQLGLIWRQDAAEPDLAFRRQVVGVLQAAQRRVAGYAKAHAEDPTAFSAATMAGLLGEAYFRLLSRTTIARSRAGIRLAYGGLSARWRVPECEIREAHPGLDLADRAFDVAALSERLNALTLAAYNPTEFLRAGVAWQEQANLSDRNRQRSLTALMRMNLLKRLESSIASFRKTAEEVLLRRTEEQQANLARGVVRVPWVTAKALLGEAEARRLAQASRGAAPSALPDGDILGEEEGEVSELLAREVDLPAERYFDVPALRKWLAADHAAVSAIVGKARAITPERDAKLQALCAVLEEKCRRPTNPGNAKALIFTAFADTAAYVAEALARRAPNRAIALVTGSDTRVWEGWQGKPETMARTLRRFAPDGQEVPKEERAGLPPVDWVVATDCLSEGQNLQDCDLVVNYDVHWNPLRLVQRIGRIDRIGSPNAYVRAVLFWPCAELNAYINLERRVRMKNAVSATVAPDGGVLGDDTRQDLAYRTRQLLAIQRGRLDLDAFVSGNRDRGFDDFLAELDVWLREGDNAKRCAAAPFGLCAVTTATLTEAFAREPLPVPTRGGAFFLLRRAGMDEAERASNPFGDCYLLAVDHEGKALIAPGEEGHPAPLSPECALRLLRALCRDRAEADPALVGRWEALGAKALTPVLEGALDLLRVNRETNRVRLLLGDLPFDFHTGLTDDRAALTLLTFALVLPEEAPTATGDAHEHV